MLGEERVTLSPGEVPRAPEAPFPATQLTPKSGLGTLVFPRASRMMED